MFHSSEKTSHIIKDIIGRLQTGDPISLGHLAKMLGDRAFFLAILVFSLPNSLPVPTPPGFTTLTGVPIMLIALQVMAGRESLWLPRRIADRPVSPLKLAKLLDKALPALMKIERLLKPRWLWMTEANAERALGLLIFLLAFIIALPIPGANFPPGLSMTLLALAMLERDGLFLAVVLALVAAAMASVYHMIALFFASANLAA